MSVRGSLIYSYGTQILSFVVSFTTSVVIARLVSPSDFGIFAIASGVSSILNLAFSFSLVTYIVREREVNNSLLRLAFTVNAMLTITMASLIYISGCIATVAFASYAVGEFLRLFAVAPLISMFEFIPNAIFTRESRFKLISIIGLMRTLTLSVVTVILAYHGFRHMSFAWAALVAAVATAAIYNMVEWRPSVWRPRVAGFRAITAYGLQMMSINGLSQLSGRLGDLLLGSMLGLTALGLYSRASGLGQQIYSNIYGAGTSVIFSRLSLDLRETGSFHESFLRALNILLALVWPMMLGVAILSQPVIHLLYGPAWQGAAWPLSLVMIAFFVALGVGMNWEVFVLRKETWLQTKIEVTRSVVGLALFSAGAMISLTAAAAAKVVESVLSYFLYRRHMDRLVGSEPGQLSRIYWTNLKVSSAAVLPSLVLMVWTSWSPETPIMAIVLSILVGAGAWLAVLSLTNHPLHTEIQNITSIVLSWNRIHAEPRQ